MFSTIALILTKLNKKMNYTFIEINKKKLPIKFGFNALRKYSSKTNTSLQDLDKLGVDMTLDEYFLNALKPNLIGSFSLFISIKV